MYPSKIGISFNTVGEEDGEALVNDEPKHSKCSRCGCNNHTMEKCTAKYRDDGTLLHTMGENKEVDYEINNEDSTEMTTNYEDPCYHGDTLMFTQPDISSLMDWSSTSYTTVRIPKTSILPDSQSTSDAFCNGELLTPIHKTNITLRTRCNTGMKTTHTRGHLLGYG